METRRRTRCRMGRGAPGSTFARQWPLMVSVLLVLGTLCCAPGMPRTIPPLEVTRLAGQYSFSVLGTEPSTVTVIFSGCFVGQGSCPSQPAADEAFKIEKKEVVKPSCSSVESCFPRLIDFSVDGLKPGKWRVSAVSDIGAPVECLVDVVDKHLNHVHFNVYNKEEERRCSPVSLPILVPISQSFLVSDPSTLGLISTAGQNLQQVLQVAGGRIDFADPQTIVAMSLSLGDVAIEGLSFRNVTIRNAGVVLISTRGGTVPVSVIPAGSVPFELGFTFNGRRTQLFLLPDEIPIAREEGTLRLTGHFNVLPDPENPLLPPFTSLEKFVPLTIDLDLHLTETLVADCNGTGVEDSTDIEEGASADVNDNGIPDECEISEFECTFTGPAQGGQVSLTLSGFSTTCTASITTTAGQPAAGAAAALAAAINTDACMSGQGISALTSDTVFRARGFLLGVVDSTSTDPGSRCQPPFSIPVLDRVGVLAMALLLALAGVLLLTRARRLRV